MLNVRFNVGEEAEAVTYELKARMTLCHMCQKKETYLFVLAR